MLSYLNWNFALTLGYLNPALNNPSSETQGADSGGKGKTKNEEGVKNGEQPGPKQ